MKKILYVLFCFCLVNLIGCENEIKKNNGLVVDKYDYENIIIGVWQASPSVGSGYDDKYHFFQDKSFRFDYNQYNGEERDISLYGKWRLEDSKLHITIYRKKTKIGGEFIKATPPSAPGYRLVNSEIVVKDLERELEIIYPLGEVIENFHSPLYMTIGNVEYWKLTNDPNSYQD